MKAMILLAITAAASAQEQLNLKSAITTALHSNASVKASEAARDGARSGITEARSGALPKMNYVESWTHSDNPVFVFSSLLTQRQFSQANFALPTLNKPDFLNDFQSQITVHQTIYDTGRTRRAVKIAELGSSGANESVRGTRMSVIVRVAKNYYAAQVAAAQLQVVKQALQSADADLNRAENRRSAGMATDADVLSIRVHLAQVREEQIQRNAELDVARAALNDAVGLPLETAHELTTPLTRLTIPRSNLDKLEQSGVTGRPEIRQAGFAQDIAGERAREARGNYLPQVTARGMFEADRQTFVTRGGANWLVSIELRWNIFNGFADKARIEANAAAMRQADAERARTESVVRLEVRRAWANLQAAEQRIETAQTSVDEAQESLRISQNRYQAGLETVMDLLRTESALLETRTRRLLAIHDQRLAALFLQFAAGALDENSEVLN